MKDADATGTAPAAPTEDADTTPKLAAQGFSSIFSDAAARHQEYVSTHQPPKKEKEKKKEPKKEAKKPTDGSAPRRQASNIIGSHISPARIQAHLREGLRTELSDKWAELTGNIRSAEARIKGKVSADENASPEQKLPPSPAEIAQLQANIAIWKEEIEKSGCEADVVRVSDNAPAALTAAADVIFLSLIDLAATNTLISDRKVVEFKYTCDPASRPSRATGGVDLKTHFVAPFLLPLSTISGYDQEEEKKILAEDTERRRNEKVEKDKRKKDAEEKANQAHAAKIQQTRAHLMQQVQSLEEHVAAGKPFPLSSGDVLTPEQAQEQATLLRQKLTSPEFDAMVPKDPIASSPKENGPRKSRDATFTSYIDQLCKTAQTFHKSYENMRVQGRFKTLIDQLIIEFVQSIARMSRASITTHTLSGANILSMLTSLQKYGGRPEDEIAFLTSKVELALERWSEHNKSEKERRKAEQLSKEQAMSREELAKLQEKRLLEERKRLENSYMAQKRREERAALAAQEQEKRLLQLGATPVAPAPSNVQPMVDVTQVGAPLSATTTNPAMTAGIVGMVPGLYQGAS